MKQDDLKYLHALNILPPLGPLSIIKLVGYFKSAEKVWEAPPEKLAAIGEFSMEKAQKIQIARDRTDIEEEWHKLSAHNINLIAFYDKNYPPRLRHIYAPPPLLYVKGRIQPEDSMSIAIVGSRRYTLYGKEVAIKFARKLSALGFTIVSGLARGIDTFAHQGALEEGGRTIAVLGTGIDKCYPEENSRLMEDISKQGAVITEFPPETEPFRSNFPRRNRIISGICLGVLVVEAPEKSGALITANLAVEQGREVFAVPGSIGSPYSRGCHKLIKDGAKLVESVDDIIEEFQAFLPGNNNANVETRSKAEPNNLSREQRKLLDIIPFTPLHIDKLIQISGLPPAKVNVILMELELKGLIKQLPGGHYVKF